MTARGKPGRCDCKRFPHNFDDETPDEYPSLDEVAPDRIKDPFAKPVYLVNDGRYSEASFKLINDFMVAIKLVVNKPELSLQTKKKDLYNKPAKLLPKGAKKKRWVSGGGIGGRYGRGGKCLVGGRAGSRGFAGGRGGTENLCIEEEAVVEDLTMDEMMEEIDVVN